MNPACPLLFSPLRLFIPANQCAETHSRPKLKNHSILIIYRPSLHLLVMQKPDDRPRIFSTDRYQLTLPEGHKFPVLKYGMLRQIIERGGFFHLEPAPLADLETVTLAHDLDYVKSFAAGALAPAAMRRIGLPWSEVLVQRAFASVGGT